MFSASSTVSRYTFASFCGANRSSHLPCSSHPLSSSILGYFQNSVIQINNEIDIDIIKALELEAEFGKDKFDKDLVKNYVCNAFNETKSLSRPFIESPIGEQRTTIPSCAFNPDIDIIDNPARHDLVSSQLRDNGGVSDCDIGKNMILFYDSIYGLRANDLSKFTPPISSKGNIAGGSHSAGEYYKAYFELISQIKPKSDETPVISPHIDRSWHLVSILPDLDAS